MSSGTYYVASGLWLCVTLIPWCAFMGATFPVAMFAMPMQAHEGSGRTFSYLYVANVLGAVTGALIPLFSY